MTAHVEAGALSAARADVGDAGADASAYACSRSCYYDYHSHYSMGNVWYDSYCGYYSYCGFCGCYCSFDMDGGAWPLTEVDELSMWQFYTRADEVGAGGEHGAEGEVQLAASVKQRRGADEAHAEDGDGRAPSPLALQGGSSSSAASLARLGQAGGGGAGGGGVGSGGSGGGWSGSIGADGRTALTSTKTMTPTTRTTTTAAPAARTARIDEENSFPGAFGAPEGRLVVPVRRGRAGSGGCGVCCA